MDKPTVSIGISAYNEQANIKNLLLNLASQKEGSILIQEVIIISDGSTDATVSEVKSVNNQKIILVDGKERVGKPARVNQLFKMFKSDYFILMDADIAINDDYLFEKLIKQFNGDTAVVCGQHQPIAPKTYIEKAIYQGAKSWNNSVEQLGKKAELYMCTGQIMALNKKFISNFYLPENLYAGIDRYIFFQAKKNNLEIVFAKDRSVFYKLPDNFTDYVKQMTRFIAIPSLMRVYFPEQLIAKYETMSFWVRMKGIIQTVSIGNIHLVISYALLQIFSKIRSRFYFKDPKWEVAQSSKLLINNKIL